MKTSQLKLKGLLTVPFALALTSLGALPSLASLPGVASVSGQATLINPPLNLTLAPFTASGGLVVQPLESDGTAFLFLEQENFFLTSNVFADITIPGLYNTQASIPPANGTIGAGTILNSYYLYSNPVGAPPINSPGERTYTGTINFEEEVLGILVTSTALRNSAQLNYPGTLYIPGTDPGLGTTLSPLRDQINFSSDRKQITFNLTTGPAADEVRILTRAPKQVPEPASVLGILALGVFGAASLFKQNQK